jgi:hypothetical protein
MTTAEDRIARIHRKIERASTHIYGVTAMIARYHESKPVRIETRRVPESRRLHYVVSRLDPPPPELPLIVGDAMHNLRSALDHLAQQLYMAAAGSNRSDRDPEFPVAEERRGVEKRIDKLRAKKVPQGALDTIVALEPWRNGRGHLLWVLHAIDAIDKHRLLVTVGANYQSMDLGAVMMAQFPELKVLAGEAKLSAFFAPAAKAIMKVGDVLYDDGPDAQPIPDLQFRSDVALSEPEVDVHEEVIGLLGKLKGAAVDTVERFRPFLA